MRSSTSRAAVLAAGAFFCIGWVEANGGCYWPNGRLAHNVFLCEPGNPGSACCGNGDYCTSTGYCLAADLFYYYRSACSDSTWRSSSCPQICADSEVESGGTWQAIMPCNVRQSLWCCGTTGPCCNNTFADPPLGTLVIPSQVTSTTSQTATVALSTVTVQPPFPGSSSAVSAECPFVNYVPIGLGVGVPLGFIASCLAAYAFWLYRALYYPTWDQKAAQIARARESVSGGYDRANDTAPDDAILLQNIEIPEPQEAQSRASLETQETQETEMKKE